MGTCTTGGASGGLAGAYLKKPKSEHHQTSANIQPASHTEILTLPVGRDQIAILSEGYPHFIQQFSYSAFDHNSDGEISLDDVLESAFKPAGAIDAIGNSYYANAFHEKIKSDEYRQVLSIMAEKMNSWITKAEIRANFTGDQSTLSNALQALTTRKIILKNPSKIGEYRLQQRGFALWIRLFGKRRKERR